MPRLLLKVTYAGSLGSSPRGLLTMSSIAAASAKLIFVTDQGAV